MDKIIHLGFILVLSLDNLFSQYLVNSVNFLVNPNIQFVETLNHKFTDSFENYSINRKYINSLTSKEVIITKIGSKIFYSLLGNSDSSLKFLFDISSKEKDTLRIITVKNDMNEFFFWGNKSVIFDTTLLIVDSIRMMTFQNKLHKTWHLTHSPLNMSIDKMRRHIFADSIGFISAHSFILQSGVAIPRSLYICLNDAILFTKDTTNYKNGAYICNIDTFINEKTNIHNVLNDISFELYPNPSEGFYEIKSNFRIQSLKVYNSMGQCLLDISDFNEKQNVLLDISYLPKGLFKIQLTDFETKITIDKIVVLMP